MNFKALSLAVLATSVLAGPALGHHSYSMFDIDKDVTLKGTVKTLEWTNPHCWLSVMAEDPATHNICPKCFDDGQVKFKHSSSP